MRNFNLDSIGHPPVLNLELGQIHLRTESLTWEIDYLFQRFLKGDAPRKGLRIQFDPPANELFAEGWVTIDLNTVESAAREAGRVSLNFEDEFFDRVLCTGLDRISRPASLIAELRRILKRSGQIWSQTPLSDTHTSEHDNNRRQYWYFTPEGLKVLFENFDEIIYSVYHDSMSKRRRDSYFYGIKPEIESEVSPQNVVSIFPI